MFKDQYFFFQTERPSDDASPYVVNEGKSITQIWQGFQQKFDASRKDLP